MKAIVKLLSLVFCACVLVSCAHNKSPYSSYSFITQGDLNHIDAFLTWRKQNPPLEKTIIAMREDYSHASDINSGIEATGPLAEYFNFLATLQPNHNSSWNSPLAVSFGDVYTGSRHYIWSNMGDIGESETKSTYQFPLHYEVLSSLKPSFFGSIESRQQLLADFNKRWNEVMEVLIYSMENHTR